MKIHKRRTSWWVIKNYKGQSLEEFYGAVNTGKIREARKKASDKRVRG